VNNSSVLELIVVKYQTENYDNSVGIAELLLNKTTNERTTYIHIYILNEATGRFSNIEIKSPIIITVQCLTLI